MIRRMLRGGVMLTVFALASAGALSAEESPAGDSPLPLGFIAPLSGEFAEFGLRIRQGLQLALEDTKHRFVVDYQDEANCEPVKALSAWQHFQTSKTIKLVVGPGCLASVKAIAPGAAHAQMLLFSTGLLDDNVLDQNRSVINWATEISAEGRQMGAFLIADGRRQVGIIHLGDAFGEEMARQVAAEIEKEGGVVSFRESVSFTDTDFQPLILKHRAEKPDAIFLSLGENQLPIFLRQLRNQGVMTPVYSQYTTETESVRKAAGEALEGVRYTYPLPGGDTVEAREHFSARFRVRFGESPSVNSAYVYDGMILLDQALDVCAVTDTVCIGNFFRHAGAQSGVSGSMTHRADGGNSRQYGLKEVRGGTGTWVASTK